MQITPTTKVDEDDQLNRERNTSKPIDSSGSPTIQNHSTEPNESSSASSTTSSSSSSASVSSATTSLQTFNQVNPNDEEITTTADKTQPEARFGTKFEPKPRASHPQGAKTSVPSWQGKRNINMDKDGGGSSNGSHKLVADANGDGGTSKSSGSSHTASLKAYKNSPFGLTRHYLTMPDDGNGIFSSQNYTLRSKGFSQDANQPGKYTPNRNMDERLEVDDDDDVESDGEDSEPVTRKSRKRSWLSARGGVRKLASKSMSSEKSNYQHDDLEVSQNQHPMNDSDLSVEASIMARNSPEPKTRRPRQGYKMHHHHHQQHNTHHVHNNNQQPHTTTTTIQPTNQPHLYLNHHQPLGHMYLNHFGPAGDAGLDAPKCNAKDIESNHGSYNHLNSHKDLKQLPQGPKLDKLGREPEECNSLLVRFSSIMYATFLVILGCILHVAELRQKSKNSTDHIYTTIVASVGILWLLFLQADLQRYKRYATKYILIETIFNDHHAQQNLDEARRREMMHGAHHHAATRSTSSSSASLVNDRLSMNTEVIFKKTAYKMYQQRAALGNRHQLNQHALPRTQRTGSNSMSRSSASQGELYDFYQNNADINHKASSTASGFGNGSSPHLDGNIDSSGSAAAAADSLVPAYKFLHGKMGANFYLKCGMAAFCFGHVIHEGLRFGQQVYFFGVGNVHCRDSAALVAHLITPLYSFYQLFMMFKYSNLVINRHKVLARFGLMHIIGTSVTFWIRTILEEAFEDFVHKMDYFKTNKPRVNLAFTNSFLPSESSHFITLLNAITNTARNSPSSTAITPSTEGPGDRSDWSFVASSPTGTSTGIGGQQNSTVGQSLFALMSSPISETITPQIVRHLPDSYACAHNTLLTTKSMNALPYLYPFTIEYNLLLAATFLSLYFNIGKIGHVSGGTGSGGNCRPPFSMGGYHANMIQKHQRGLGAHSHSHGQGSNVESSDNSEATRMREADVGGGGGWGGDMHHKYLGEYKSNFVVNADCHSANKGLFCGFFVLLVTLVTIVIFFVTINKPTHIQLGIKINLIQEATLTALILIVTLAGFKQVVKLNRNPYLKDKVTTDDVLMLIPLPFFFIHSLLSFRAETASMSAASGGGSGESPFSSLLLQKNHIIGNDPMTTSNGNLQSILLGTSNTSRAHIESRSRLNNLLAGRPNGTNGRFVEEFISNSNSNNNNGSINGRNIDNIDAGNSNSSQIDHFKLITVALNIVVMIEVLVQTNFIIDGMRRCSESRYLRFKKPGRELITFAILLNITYWIVATFETKSVEQYKTEIEYYGPLPYMIISHTTLPVMLFYRYHSSVCLAEIWNRAYKPPKKR